MNTEEKIEAIETVISGWMDAGNAMAGLEAWAWDSREEFLEAVLAGDLDQFANDLDYTVQQVDEYRGGDFEDAAREWLEHNRQDIIDTLAKSLMEEGLEKDPIPGWAITAALDRLIDEGVIEKSSWNDRGQGWLAERAGVSDRQVRNWVSGERALTDLRAEKVRAIILEAMG